ncbi:MAG TPA: response regulator [Nitrososphaeraceae archaeon]|nr:response regulator [Nitrososphaeraceae archaeon]
MQISNKESSQKKIIICDDEKDLLFLYKEALGLKYSIITTTDGKECIDKYKELREKSPVDLILVDYKLKDMNGEQVACEINKINGVKIMLISAYDLEKEKISDLIHKKCIFGFISKTIGVKNLLDEVSKILS